MKLAWEGEDISESFVFYSGMTETPHLHRWPHYWRARSCPLIIFAASSLPPTDGRISSAPSSRRPPVAVTFVDLASIWRKSAVMTQDGRRLCDLWPRLDWPHLLTPDWPSDSQDMGLATDLQMSCRRAVIFEIQNLNYKQSEKWIGQQL